MRSKEVERFAARIRALKDRAGISFEQLAGLTGISGSSLHRYCSGAKIPTGYGVVHTFAKACGADAAELRELHRLWALADAARSPSTVPDGSPPDVTDNELDTPGPRRPHRRGLTLAMVTVTVVTATAASGIALRSAVDRQDATAGVRVFNVDEGCRKRSDRVPGCSIGLARDPQLNYDAHNVVAHRVWHGDALNADCIVYDGDEVTDENGAKSTRWYRVHLDDVPDGQAWLSGLRTRDNPALPTCVL